MADTAEIAAQLGEVERKINESETLLRSASRPALVMEYTLRVGRRSCGWTSTVTSFSRCSWINVV